MALLAVGCVYWKHLEVFPSAARLQPQSLTLFVVVVEATHQWPSLQGFRGSDYMKNIEEPYTTRYQLILICFLFHKLSFIWQFHFRFTPNPRFVGHSAGSSVVPWDACRKKAMPRRFAGETSAPASVGSMGGGGQGKLGGLGSPPPFP